MRTPHTDERGAAAESILSLVMFPLYFFLMSGFLIPTLVRAAIEPPVDNLVQAYVHQYAAYGSLTVPEYSPTFEGQSTKRIDVSLRNALVASGLIQREGLDVVCGPYVGGRIEATAPVKAGSTVGCVVRGVMNGWPEQGPLMRAAPAIFGTQYVNIVLATTDRGSNDNIQ